MDDETRTLGNGKCLRPFSCQQICSFIELSDCPGQQHKHCYGEKQHSKSKIIVKIPKVTQNKIKDNTRQDEINAYSPRKRYVHTVSDSSTVAKVPFLVQPFVLRH